MFFDFSLYTKKILVKIKQSSFVSVIWNAPHASWTFFCSLTCNLTWKKKQFWQSLEEFCFNLGGRSSQTGRYRNKKNWHLIFQIPNNSMTLSCCLKFKDLTLSPLQLRGYVTNGELPTGFPNIPLMAHLYCYNHGCTFLSSFRNQHRIKFARLVEN